MSITDIGKVCLFSGMSGVVMLNGEPAANAQLVRTASLSTSRTDETFTDKDGRFEFAPACIRTMAKYLPMEFVAKQNIVVHYNGQAYAMWDGVKRKPEENAESRGKPLVVQCELGMEEQAYSAVLGGVYFTRCTWDVEQDPPYEGSIFDPGPGD